MKKCTICGNPDIYNIAFNRDKSDYSMKPSHYQMVHKLSDSELPEELHGYYCNMCKKLVDVTNMEKKSRGHEPLTHDSNSEKCYLVLVGSSFARDTQALPGDYFAIDNNKDYADEWIDWNGDIAIGLFWSCCMNGAIKEAADKEQINPKKLIAYEVTRPATKGEAENG